MTGSDQKHSRQVEKPKQCAMKLLHEQHVLVTGSTDGIGKLTALRLARMGATVYLHGRDREKCQAVRDELRKASGNHKLQYFQADFSSLADVRKMASAFSETHGRLDILINNAGVLPAGSGKEKRHLSSDGNELCLAVNYLAPFLLTHLLLPCLLASAAARIINVCSAAQEPLDFDDMMINHGYSSMSAYARSKLALVMFTFELNERLKSKSIAVNCIHPGSLLDTKMVRQYFSRPMGSAESGAEAIIRLATASDVENISGAYFDQTKPSRAHPQAYDLLARGKLWRISQDLTDCRDNSFFLCPTE
ncbi:MAG: SDR family NAD(P)-dependent oxidoreductase [Desulfobacterales bacterium]